MIRVRQLRHLVDVQKRVNNKASVKCRSVSVFKILIRCYFCHAFLFLCIIRIVDHMLNWAFIDE